MERKKFAGQHLQYILCRTVNSQVHMYIQMYTENGYHYRYMSLGSGISEGFCFLILFQMNFLQKKFFMNKISQLKKQSSCNCRLMIAKK